MGDRQLRTSIMKLVVCFALIALAAASPTSREDSDAWDLSASNSKDGMDVLWGIMSGMSDRKDSNGMRDMEDLLMLFHNGIDKEQDDSHQKGMEDMMKHMMMAQAGGQREAESKGGIDDLWGVLAAAHDNERGMGARAQAATADRDITDMLELFGAGMMDEKKSEKSMGGMKDLLELFGIGMESSEKSESNEESKSKSMEDMMDADAEEMKKWAEKTFMALLEHRMEYGDMEGVMKMMAWAAKMDADRVRAAGHKLMSDEEAEAHFEMLFMKALEAKTAEGDWEAVAAMMQMGEEWEKGAAAADIAIASAEMQMHLIYMEVMKHKAHIGDWKGVVNMMEGAVLMTAYRLQDPRERLTEEEVKGHKAYMMLLKNKAAEGDWKSVVKMMNWGVQEMAKKQKKEMAEAVFSFGHLLIGGSPDMSEWAR